MCLCIKEPRSPVDVSLSRLKGGVFGSDGAERKLVVTHWVSKGAIFCGGLYSSKIGCVCIKYLGSVTHIFKLPSFNAWNMGNFLCGESTLGYLVQF